MVSYHSSVTHISQELELALTCTIQNIVLCGNDNLQKYVSCWG